MWDVVRTMNWEGVFPFPTLISVFQSYSMVGRINEVVMSFDVMDIYDVEKNVVVINWFYVALFPTLWHIICILSAWWITKKFVKKKRFFAKMIKNEWLPPTSSNCVVAWHNTWYLELHGWNSCWGVWCECKYVAHWSCCLIWSIASFYEKMMHNESDDKICIYIYLRVKK